MCRRFSPLLHSEHVSSVGPTPFGLSRRRHSGEAEITSVDGSGTEVLLGVTLSAETSRSAHVMQTGISEVIEDLSVAANVPSEVIELGLGPGLYVPLVADERRLGRSFLHDSMVSLAYQAVRYRVR